VTTHTPSLFSATDSSDEGVQRFLRVAHATFLGWLAIHKLTSFLAISALGNGQRTNPRVATFWFFEERQLDDCLTRTTLFCAFPLGLVPPAVTDEHFLPVGPAVLSHEAVNSALVVKALPTGGSATFGPGESIMQLQVFHSVIVAGEPTAVIFPHTVFRWTVTLRLTGDNHRLP
jgi:hypothetical protein